MNTKIIVGIVVLVIIIGGFFLFNKRTEAPQDIDSASGTSLSGSEDAGRIDTPELEEGNDVKPFTLEASNFKYSISSMTVKKGDTVRLTLISQGGMHDWNVDEFDASTRVLNAGESETIEFVADKAGTFEYYCSVGSHRQMGMVGTLVVEE